MSPTDQIVADEQRTGCDCLTQLSERLAKEDSNTIIGASMVLDMRTGEQHVVVEIATYKRDPKKREKKRGMIPTFCPFCGTRYQPEPDGAS